MPSTFFFWKLDFNMSELKMEGREFLLFLFILCAFEGVLGAGDECAPPRLEEATSLARCLSLVTYGSQQVAPLEAVSASADLKVFLDANFRSKEGIFEACCQQQTVSDYHVRVNPLDEVSLRLESHLVRNEPTFNFYLRDNSGVNPNEGNFYMILVFDFSRSDINSGTVARPFCHLAIVNINGLQSPVGETVVNYLSPTYEGRPYVYLLFKQQGQIKLDLDGFTMSSQDCSGLFLHRCLWNIAALISQYQLELLGATWHYVVTTTWSLFYSIQHVGEPETEVCKNLPGNILRVDQNMNRWIECSWDRCKLEHLTGSGDETNMTLCLDDIKTSLILSWPEIFGSAFFGTYIDATFRSPEWNLEVCCHTENYDATMVKINPTKTKSIPGHVVMNPPQLEFYSMEYSPLHQDDLAQTTLILVDLSSLHITDLGQKQYHVYWLLTNIVGMRLSTANTVVPYHCPIIQNHDYVLILFKQDTSINLELNRYTTTRCIRNTRICAMAVNDMVVNLALKAEGATRFQVEKSWFQPFYELNTLNVPMQDVCTEDPRAVIRNAQVICPHHACVFEKFSDPVAFANCMESVHKRALILAPEHVKYSDSLKVFIDVTFQRSRKEFQMCCEWTVIPESMFKLNPLANEKPDIFEISGEKMDISLVTSSDSSVLSPASLSYFTLVMIDISGGAPFFRPDLPFLHLAIIDIPDLDLNQGQVVLPLFKPAVPNDHVFLLYRQSFKLSPGVDIFTYGKHSDACPSFAEGRCLFDLQRLVREQGLLLMGVTWVTPRASQHSWIYNYLYIRGESEVDTCKKFAPYIVTSGDRIVCPSQPSCTPDKLAIATVTTKTFQSCLAALKQKGYQEMDLFSLKDTLSVYLHITYKWTTAVLKECCSETSWISNSQVIDPLQDQNIKNYQLQGEPEVKFLLPPNSREGETNSLYFMCLVAAPSGESFFRSDPLTPMGRVTVLWAVVNIPELDLSSGNLLYPYISPSRNTLHAFLLFRQSTIFNVDSWDEYTMKDGLPVNCYPEAPGRCGFDLVAIVDDMDLELVGLSWVKPETDHVYTGSVEIGLGLPKREVCPSLNPLVSLSSTGDVRCPSARCDVSVMAEIPSLVQTCLQSMQQAASWVTLPIKRHIRLDLHIFIHLHYEEKQTSYRACRRSECVPASKIQINPLDNTRPYNYQLRSEPKITFFINPGSGISIGDETAHFSMLLLDIGGENVSPDKDIMYPYIYWLKSNIVGLDMETGHDVLPYWGPDLPHNYVFYLFHQEDIIGFSLQDYAAGAAICGDPAKNRCGFKFQSFIEDLGLELLGVSWVKPTMSPYTSWRMIQLNEPCPEIPDWLPNCDSPTPGLATTTSSSDQVKPSAKTSSATKHNQTLPVVFILIINVFFNLH